MKKKNYSLNAKRAIARHDQLCFKAYVDGRDDVAEYHSLVSAIIKGLGRPISKKRKEYIWELVRKEKNNG